MAHKIVEAIIENGQIKHIDKKLPRKRMKVHLIYDEVKESISIPEVARVVRETSGLYGNVDAEAESRKLRRSWERDVHE